MRMTKTKNEKKASFTGMGQVANYVLILVILAVMLYLIYSLLWDKTIQGGIKGIIDETNVQTDKAQEKLTDLTGEDPSGGENGNQGGGNS